MAIGIGIPFRKSGEAAWTQALSDQKIAEFMDLEFGSFICYSLSTFAGADLGVVNGDPDVFNPTDLDIDDWIDSYVAAGMKYAVLPAKTNDGFCLWPTNFATPTYDPYSISQSTWYQADPTNRDIVKLFIDSCKAKNIKPILYFSIIDLTHEDRSETNEITGADAYNAMIETQVTELLSNYGDITALWFDGWQWSKSYTYIPYEPVFQLVKKLQKNCLVLNNDHNRPNAYSEIELHETCSGVAEVPEGNTTPAEQMEKIRSDGNWNYIVTDDQQGESFYSALNLYGKKVQVNSRFANFILTSTPDLTGHLLNIEKSIHRNIYELNSVNTLVYNANTILWYKASNEGRMVKTEATGAVSKWLSENTQPYSLLQATGSKQPIFESDVITFDGLSQFLKTTNVALNQPLSFYIVLKQVTWTDSVYFIDGISNAQIVVGQFGTTPGIKSYAGASSSQNDNLAVNTFGIIRAFFNGASSKLQVNNTTAITGNFGTGNMGALTLGSRGDNTASFSNIAVKEIIIRNIIDTSDNEKIIYNYLASKHGFSTI